MRIAETINSPNQSSRSTHIPRLIVYHLADGTYEGTKSWVMNRSAAVSYHFLIGLDGRICQCVPLDRMAWANGTTTAPASDNRHFSRSTVQRVLTLGGNANQYSVSIGFEGFWRDRQGAISAAQLDSAVWLTRHIQAAVQRQFAHVIPLDREHLVGHFEINPRTRPNCPGQAFPWGELVAQLNDRTHLPTGTLYRVQVGAFRSRDNAEAFLQTVRDLNLDAFIVEGDDGLFRVQLGAFASRDNATNFANTVRQRDSLEAFVTIAAR